MRFPLTVVFSSAHWAAVGQHDSDGAHLQAYPAGDAANVPFNSNAKGTRVNSVNILKAAELQRGRGYHEHLEQLRYMSALEKNPATRARCDHRGPRRFVGWNRMPSEGADLLKY